MPSETLARAQAEWDALETEVRRLGAELELAKSTTEHLIEAIGHTAGHDRQGLDHLAAAQRADKARASAAQQARAWKNHARALEKRYDELAEELRGLRSLCSHLTPAEIQAARERENIARIERARAILADATA